VALMLRHHRGSGRRKTIEAEWSRHHRPSVNGTHTSVVSLRRSGGTRGVWDDVNGVWTTTPKEPYYVGPARIQMVSDSDLKRIVADQQISTLVYRIGLANTVTGMELGDKVTVISTDDNGDPGLVGRVFTVDTIVWSSLHWERVLVCIDSLEKVT
jgi:hypothetical protein